MSGAVQEQYLQCVESACAHLDAVEEYGISTGQAAGLLVLHGLAMYARDTSRSALTLISGRQTLGAAALTRVVIEHAALAQWLKMDLERRAALFLRQSEVERYRWYKVVEAAKIELPETAREARKAETRPKNVASEFDTPKKLFGDTGHGNQIYLTYRNLSQFVHPAASTFARYTTQLPYGLQLLPRCQNGQDPESLAFYLAAAIVMCTLPYLIALGEEHAADELLTQARTANLPTSLAGAPPS